MFVYGELSKKILFIKNYQIFLRSGDVHEKGHVFYSEVHHIFYTPAAVTINSKPKNPLLASADRCTLTSSVPGSIPANAISANGGKLIFP